MSVDIVIIIVCIILSAFFSGMEIAFLSSNKLILELDKKESNKFRTHILNIFTRHANEYVSTMLVGNNIMLVIYGIAVANVFDEPLKQIIHNDGTVLLVETILSTLVILITAEFLPKTIFRIKPNFFVKTLCYPAYFFYIILYPINKITVWLSGSILYIFGFRANKNDDESAFNRRDLFYLSNELATDEAENEHDIRIFQNALSFPEIKIRECMVPRNEIKAIDTNTPIDELKQLFIKTGYSRILVYQDTTDNMIGYINSKDLFKPYTDASSLLRPIDYVPESMSAQKLLTTFIKNKKSIAIVVDEFGGTAGLVTIEDIMEEIFGDIEDEHDSDDLVEKELPDNEFILSGRLEVDYLNDKYELGIPESDEYETLAGYIISTQESIPQRNEELHIDNLKIRIISTTATRINLVKLKIISGINL